LFVTAPRRIVPGDIHHVTRRCTRREFLLVPDEVTKAILDYCLAEAAKRFGIGLIAWSMMSNHYHAVVHDPKGTLPSFLEHFHKMVAKAFNARYGRWENFWSTEETCVTRLVTDQDVFDAVVYVLANPLAADLVDRYGDWPGSSSFGYLGGKKTTHRRPKFYFAEDGVMPEEVTLAATLPGRITKRESRADWTARLRKALAEREKKIREERVAQKRKLVGRKKVLRLEHTDAPKTSAPRRGLRPALACKEPDRRNAELAALVDFRARYKAARERWSAGDRRAEFPAGTYRLRSLGVRCAPHPTLR
jgi:REP element-mobilizing transposase RayT